LSSLSSTSWEGWGVEVSQLLERAPGSPAKDAKEAKDAKKPDEAKAQLEAVVKANPEFLLARVDLADLTR
jgi:hypothetical protein